MQGRDEPVGTEKRIPREQYGHEAGPRIITVVKSDWYCPSCGKQDMWQDVNCSGGDYYHEHSVTCLSCRYDMCCVDVVKRQREAG